MLRLLVFEATSSGGKWDASAYTIKHIFPSLYFSKRHYVLLKYIVYPTKC